MKWYTRFMNDHFIVGDLDSWRVLLSGYRWLSHVLCSNRGILRHFMIKCNSLYAHWVSSRCCWSPYHWHYQTVYCPLRDVIRPLAVESVWYERHYLWNWSVSWPSFHTASTNSPSKTNLVCGVTNRELGYCSYRFIEEVSTNLNNVRTRIILLQCNATHMF